MKLQGWALWSGAAAALVALASDARAQSQPQMPYTFETVDSYAIDADSSDYGMLSITGVLKGASAPFTLPAQEFSTPALAACERMAVQMVNRPGRFYLTIAVLPNPYRLSCTLTRRP